MNGAPIKDKYLSMRGKTCSSSSVDKSAISLALLSPLASVVCFGMRTVHGGAAAFASRSWCNANLAEGN